MNSAPWRIGVDIGGTFTDLVMLDSRDGRIFNGKILTTPHAPEEAVLEGVRDLLARTGAQAEDVRHVIHGTTLVANALIERRGVPTGLITTKGFRDILEIGTELRHDTYDLFMRVPEPLVPRHRRLGVAERLLPDGSVRESLDEAGAREAVRALRDAGAKAVAVCFLHAFRNPTHEARMREILAEEVPDLTVCLSSEVVPEIGEYERASTTVCNAYVQPVFERYLRRLSDGLRGFGLTGPLFLMLSDGGTVAEETAARHPIRLVQSGPAGGVEATGIYGAAAGARDILCFDMGGTTAKAALIDNGEAQRSLDFEVARVDRFRKGSGLPLKVPVIDMIEIGAGGGSIARVDQLGLVRVGPESASSDPGPACYGLGGTRPTVTDADLVLGYLGAESFLGGAMKLNVAAAEAALAEHIGKPLGLSVPEAAWAIHETVNGNMAQAAAIHIGMKLGLKRIIVPLGAGVASAFGFLAAPISFAFVQGWVAPLAGLDFAKLREITGSMTAQGKAMAAAAGVAPEAASARILGAMRYAGQGFQVEAEIPEDAITQGDAAALRAKFEAAYLALYGRTEPALPVECVSWQVIVAGPRPVVDLTRQGASAEGALHRGTRRAWFGGAYVETPVLNRLALRPGESVAGPALIEERECTLVLPPGATE
jgi:N-methylhydantoinase A